MKAIFIERYGTPEKAFQIKEIPSPTPQSHQVLIEVKAFGINYADIMARQGMYRDAPKAPFVPGYEVAGIVKATCGNVTRFKQGDKVLAFTRFGGYATEALTDERAVVKIPEKLSFEEATHFATQFCTAYYSAYTLANVQPEETVLVHAAAGGVGTALCQLLKLKNCKIYGTASSPAKLDFLKSQNVVPINYRKEDFKQFFENKNINPDVIFDSIGGATYKKGRQILAAGGRIIAYGGAGRSKGLLKTIKFALDFGFIHPVELLMKSQSALGVNMLRIADHKPEVLQSVMQNVIALYNEEKIHPVIDRVFNFSEIANAHKHIESRKSIGKVVVQTDKN
ncbi:MAG: alcohol dehydrogenase [Bacteroidetes bacterium]|nr:MAG: alcohol dehydrogenase [Bacteroidota bacterium]